MSFPDTTIWLILGGLISGSLAGLLGIGGGIIIVPLLVTLGYIPVKAAATSSLVIVISSTSGSIQNWRMGYFDLQRVLYLAIPALTMAQIGVYIASHIPAYLLLFLFGILLLVNIYLVQLKKQLSQSRQKTPKVKTKAQFKIILSRIITGGVGGILAGLFGIGGGVILVPFQMLLLGEPIKLAIQTSLGVIIGTSVATCIGHAANGNVLFIEGSILGIGGLIGSQFSTRLLPKIPDKAVSLSFRLFLGILSFYIFWQSWHLTNSVTFLGSAAICVLLFATIAGVALINSKLKLYPHDRFNDRVVLMEPDFFKDIKEWETSPTNQKVRRDRSRWWIFLLLILVCLQSSILIWSNRGKIAQTVTQVATLAGNSNCQTPKSIQQEQDAYLQICSSMQDILEVPEGDFFYGGSMGAAALRSSNVLNEINQAHPGFRLRYLDPLSIPPDSKTGIRMLLNGELSFSESQRPLTDAEFAQARLRGYSLKQIPVAMTGIVFFVHPDLDITGLSLDRLQKIYIGQITNWNQVGGEDLPIIPISQDTDRQGSTMGLLLQNLPVNEQRLPQTTKIVRDTTASIRMVAKTPGAIGFGTQATVINQRTIRPIGLARSGSQNYVRSFTPDGRANKMVLLTGSYPLVQRIFVVIRQDGTLDELAGIAYANLLLSQKGQNLVDRAGYLPIRQKESAQ
jgi:uncharacterized membrane protein YfcA/ABC-type phosphate transport system substrate-binding protein